MSSFIVNVSAYIIMFEIDHLYLGLKMRVSSFNRNFQLFSLAPFSRESTDFCHSKIFDISVDHVHDPGGLLGLPLSPLHGPTKLYLSDTEL